MAVIVLISCGKKKLNHRSKARDMYISPLFKMSLKYAEKLKPDKIFILSAKHHLLPIEEEIDPYDMTLNKMKLSEVKQWGDTVLEQLSKETDIGRDTFILLAGERYAKFLRNRLGENVKEPLRGLSLGQRLKFLKSNL